MKILSISNFSGKLIDCFVLERSVFENKTLGKVTSMSKLLVYIILICLKKDPAYFLNVITR